MLVAIELQQSHSWRAHPQISVAILDHAHYTGQCIRRRLLPIESVLRQYVRRPVIDREALAGRVVDPKLPESIFKESNLNPIGHRDMKQDFAGCAIELVQPISRSHPEVAAAILTTPRDDVGTQTARVAGGMPIVNDGPGVWIKSVQSGSGRQPEETAPVLRNMNDGPT